MLKKITFIGIVAVMALAGVSCNKKDDLRKATIIRTGDITYEGCGYLLKLDDAGEIIKPNYLPGAYQHPNIRVTVSYDHTGVVDTCDYSPKIFDVVNLKTIELLQE